MAVDKIATEKVKLGNLWADRESIQFGRVAKCLQQHGVNQHTFGCLLGYPLKWIPSFICNTHAPLVLIITLKLRKIVREN